MTQIFHSSKKKTLQAVLLLIVLFIFKSINQKSIFEVGDFFSELDSIEDSELSNEDPNFKIIGILTQPISRFLNEVLSERFENKNDFDDADNLNSMTFFASSYQKWLSRQRTLFVPINSDLPIAQLKEQLKHINAIMLPGGATNIMSTTEEIIEEPNAIIHSITKKPTIFALKVFSILDELEKLQTEHNKKVPVFGTCLGFELLLLHSANKLHFANVNNLKYLTEVEEFEPEDQNQSENLHPFIRFDTLDKIHNKNIFYFNHRWGLPVEDFEKNDQLTNSFEIVATVVPKNSDESHRLVAAVQHKTQPIYGVQFHPEKNLFEKHLHLPNDPQVSDITKSLNEQYFGKIQSQIRKKDIEFWKEHSKNFKVFKAEKTGIFDEVVLFRFMRRNRVLSTKEKLVI